eukprot:Gb_25916 [translate_table: standard]
METTHEIMCSADKQEAQHTYSAEITTPSTEDGQQDAPRQPFTDNFGVSQCKDTLLVSNSTKTPDHSVPITAFTTKQCSSSDYTELESLKYMPILQTYVKGHRFVSKERNKLCLGNGESAKVGMKRKLSSPQKQPRVNSARGLAEENQHFSKSREQLEDAKNYRWDAEVPCQNKQKIEHSSSPYHDSIPQNFMKQHIVHTNNVKDTKMVNRFANLQSLSTGNVRPFPHPMALESNRNGTVSSASFGHVFSSRLDVHSHGEVGNISVTAPLKGTKAGGLSNQPNTGNSVEISSVDCHCQSMSLRHLTSPAYAPMPAPLSTFSSGGPSLPWSMENPSVQEESHLTEKGTRRMSSPDSDWGKFLALSATPESSNKVNRKIVIPFQERFIHLQAFLKQCDESDLLEYLKILRSLSAAARSGLAVDLETRAIKLSLEEGKELHRMKVLDVFGKNFTSDGNDAGTTPQGPRLPAPGTLAFPNWIGKNARM